MRQCGHSPACPRAYPSGLSSASPKVLPRISAWGPSPICHECLREWACKPSILQSNLSELGLALQRLSVQDLPIILPRVSPRLANNLSKSIAKTPFFCTAGVSNPTCSFDMRLVKVGTLSFGSLTLICCL